MHCLFNHFQQYWKIIMHKDCQSVCERCSFCIYTSNVLKLMNVIWDYYTIIILKMVYIRLKVDVQRVTKNFDTLRSVGGNFKKSILTCLCCTKCNDINVSHSDIQKYTYYKNDIKRFNFSSIGSHRSV